MNDLSAIMDEGRRVKRHSLEDESRNLDQLTALAAALWELAVHYAARPVARVSLGAIVLLPLFLMPFSGAFIMGGLDTLLFKLYSLLGAAGLCCAVLQRPETTRSSPILPTAVRAVYMAAFFVTPVLTRQLSWSAYMIIPLGVAGLLTVRNLRSCWFADLFVVSTLRP